MDDKILKAGIKKIAPGDKNSNEALNLDNVSDAQTGSTEQSRRNMSSIKAALDKIKLAKKMDSLEVLKDGANLNSNEDNSNLTSSNNTDPASNTISINLNSQNGAFSAIDGADKVVPKNMSSQTKDGKNLEQSLNSAQKTAQDLPNSAQIKVATSQTDLNQNSESKESSLLLNSSLNLSASVHSSSNAQPNADKINVAPNSESFASQNNQSNSMPQSDKSAIKEIKKQGLRSIWLPIAIIFIGFFAFALIVGIFFKGDFKVATISMIYFGIQFKFISIITTLTLAFIVAMSVAVPLHKCFTAIAKLSNESTILEDAETYLKFFFANIIFGLVQIFIIFLALSVSINLASITKIFIFIQAVLAIFTTFYHYQIFNALSKLSGVSLFKIGAISHIVFTFFEFIVVNFTEKFEELSAAASLIYLIFMVTGFIKLKAIARRQE